MFKMKSLKKWVVAACLLTGVIAALPVNEANAQNFGSCIHNDRTGELRCIGDLVRIISNSYGAYGLQGRIIDIRGDQNRRPVLMVNYIGNDRRQYTLAFYPQETERLSQGNPGYPGQVIRVGDQVRIVSNSYGAYGIVGVVVDSRRDPRGVLNYMVRYIGNDGRSYVMSFFENELAPLNNNPGYPDRLIVGDTVRIVSNSYGAYGLLGRVSVIRVEGNGVEVYYVQYRGNDGVIYSKPFQRHELRLER